MDDLQHAFNEAFNEIENSTKNQIKELDHLLDSGSDLSPAEKKHFTFGREELNRLVVMAEVLPRTKDGFNRLSQIVKETGESIEKNHAAVIKNRP